MALVKKAVTHVLFPSVEVKKKEPCLSRTPLSATYCHEELPVAVDKSGSNVCAKAAYHCRVSLGISPSAMHITQWRFNSEIRQNLVSKAPITQPCKHYIQRELLQISQRATKYPLHVKIEILFHIRFGTLCLIVWYGVIPYPAAGMPLGTLLIDKYLCGIFPSKHNFVPWDLRPVVILSTYHHQWPMPSQKAALPSKKMLCKHIEVPLIPIGVARKVVLEALTPHSVVTTISTSEILTVNPRAFEKSMHMLFPTYGGIDTIQSQNFPLTAMQYFCKSDVSNQTIGDSVCHGTHECSWWPWHSPNSKKPQWKPPRE